MVSYKTLAKAWGIIDSGSFENKSIEIVGTIDFVRIKNWTIALGGYDTGYEVSYNDTCVMTVNYEYRTVEFATTRGLNEKKLLKAMECESFEIINEED